MAEKKTRAPRPPRAKKPATTAAETASSSTSATNTEDSSARAHAPTDRAPARSSTIPAPDPDPYRIAGTTKQHRAACRAATVTVTADVQYCPQCQKHYTGPAVPR